MVICRNRSFETGWSCTRHALGECSSSLKVLVRAKKKYLELSKMQLNFCLVWWPPRTQEVTGSNPTERSKNFFIPNSSRHTQTYHWWIKIQTITKQYLCQKVEHWIQLNFFYLHRFSYLGNAENGNFAVIKACKTPPRHRYRHESRISESKKSSVLFAIPTRFPGLDFILPGGCLSGEHIVVRTSVEEPSVNSQRIIAETIHCDWSPGN